MTAPDNLGQWAEDSSGIRDIRMRWVMCYMAEYYQQMDRPITDRLMMRDIYNWIREDKPTLEDFVNHVYRASFVHRVLSGTANDRPSDNATDALRKNDIILSLETVFEWP